MTETDVPRYEIAERALKKIEATLDHMEGSDWSHTIPAREIRHIVTLANVNLRMMSLRRRRPGANWLAKVGSFVYPRRFAGEWGGDPNPHHCIQFEITDGPKALRDRYVEVQIPDDDMERLARQMLSMIEARKRAKGDGR
ncbi:hypothetical protein ACFW2V_14085 [Streptomyces sp. NPDC058947]|uniref:hypothetical protein n=1 Tax=Streptomyces sp. NPDC058947 TaxID=3346675 RepID=UPI003679A5B0